MPNPVTLFPSLLDSSPPHRPAPSRRSSPLFLSLPASLDPLLNHLVELAQAHRVERGNKIPIVAIGGCPGVGKTHLTGLLRQDLEKYGVSVKVIAFDDWENPIDQRSEDFFNLKGASQFLEALNSNQRKLTKPTCEQLTDVYGSEEIDLSNVDLILFEGLYSLTSLPELDFIQYCELGIFVEAAEKDISNWKWEREQAKKEPRSEEEFKKHIDAVLEVYHDKILPYKGNASYVVFKDQFHHYFLH